MAQAAKDGEFEKLKNEFKLVDTKNKALSQLSTGLINENVELRTGSMLLTERLSELGLLYNELKKENERLIRVNQAFENEILTLKGSSQEQMPSDS